MKISKRIIALLLALTLAFGYALSIGVYASTANLRYFERGVLTDGQNTAYYIIDKDSKTLHLTGDGVTNARTPDYPNADSGPFANRNDVTTIVIEENVERVGDYVFANMKSVDTLEVQSNLLSSESNMSSKAMSGCTALRHIRGESAFLSTDVLLEVVKGAFDIASGSWLSLAAKGLNIIRTGVSNDTLPDEIVHAMVNDYITNGQEIFLGDLDVLVAQSQAREQELCYWDNAYHHDYERSISSPQSCTSGGKYLYTCSVCGAAYLEDIGEPLGHDYIYETLYETSCLKEGISKGVCSRCGDIKLVSIPATGHSEGRWVTTKAPESGVSGTIQCLCEDCSEIIRTVDVNIINTTYRRYKVGLDANDNTAAVVAGEYERANYASAAVRNGVILSDDERVGTGCQIIVSYAVKGQVNDIYTVVLYGDVDGDGIIGNEDYSILSDRIYGSGEPFAKNSPFARAADLNHDGTTDAFDLALLDLQISGVKPIDQSEPQY